MKKKLKSDFVLIGFLLFFIIFLIFLYINFERDKVIDKRVIYAKVLVGDKYGFDINGTALTFGMITPGGSSSTREIELTNKYNRDVEVEIYSDGNIKDFLRISQENFILRRNESIKIKFTVSVPLECEFGTYEGNVKVLIKRINN
jgi:hypothetical protein